MRRTTTEGGRDRRLIAGILLAAGRSSRFGRQKLLEPWNGKPLLRQAASRFLDAGLDPVVAVISGDARLRQALDGLPLSIVDNDEPEAGISRSIALGVGSLPPDCDGALIGVADQPYVTVGALSALLAAYRGGMIVVPRYGDHQGNPSIFDRRYFGELQHLAGDRGGQRVIAKHPDQLVEVALDASMGVDIDRPEDWPG